MRNFRFQGHYTSWWKNRFDTLEKILVPNFFRDKTVLDIGSGYGNFAQMIHELGAKVTCSEGRDDHISVISKKYPHLEVRNDDYEIPFPHDFPKYDVILHFGVAYHIQNIENHLLSLADKCDYLFLDCEVIDSNDIHACCIEEETGYDQSLHGKGNYHTEAYYEQFLTSMGFSFVKICDRSLDTTMHKYTWIGQNTGNHMKLFSYRRLWICSQSQDKLQKCISSTSIEINHILDMFSKNTMRVLQNTLVSFRVFANAISDNKPRISLITPVSLVETYLALLSQHNYDIYSNTPMLIDSKFANIMAVKRDTINREEFTFVLQGPKTSKNLDIAKNIAFVHGIPLDCTWDDKEFKMLRFEVSRNRYANRQNIFFQTYGTLKGINASTTKYVIKMRSDEYYSNILPLLHTIKSMPEKIISNNVFARKIIHYPYHISDHVIGGTRENMLAMFETSLDFLKKGKLNGICAEQHLTKCFIHTKGDNCDMKDSRHIKNLTKKHFHIISIKTLGDYEVNARSVNKFTLTNHMSEVEYKKFIDIESIDDM